MQKLTHHEFKAEWIDDEDGPAVMIEQIGNGDGDLSVILHPHQLRQVCEHFGILATDDQAAKTIAALQRRMVILRNRIDELGDALLNNNALKHVDLDHELSLVAALFDLACEWCRDFVEAAPNAAGATPQPVQAEAMPGDQATLI